MEVFSFFFNIVVSGNKLSYFLPLFVYCYNFYRDVSDDITFIQALLILFATPVFRNSQIISLQSILFEFWVLGIMIVFDGKTLLP